MPNKYDVIVIGAGIGGLTAAAILARNGKKVLVLEKIHVAGGYAVNFKRGGFEFDASLHLLNGFVAGKPTYRFLELAGIDKKVKFLKPKYLYRSIFPDYDIRVPQCNPEGYLEILGKLFPAEKDKLRRLFRLMYRIFCRIQNIEGNKASPAEFTDYVNKTYQEVLDEFEISEKLAAVISQICFYIGLPPSQLPFFVFLSSWCDYVYNGGYYPKGGGQAVANALVEVIKEGGSDVIFRKEVIKILIKDGSAYGVEVKDDGVHLADKIISNADARTTFNNLIEKELLPASYLDKISKMEQSLSIFQVYLGLSVDFNEKGIDDYVVFINPDSDVTKYFRSFLNNDFYNSPLGVTFCSRIENSFVPNGKSTISIITLAGYDFWENLSKDDYKKKKKEMANVLIKRVVKLIPNLESCIEMVDIATPATMLRYTGNYKGSIYGWDQIRDQHGSKRMKQKTVVDNLFLVGAWTEPAGGIAGVMQSGAMVARRI